MQGFGALFIFLAFSRSFAFFFAPMPTAPKASLRSPHQRAIVSTTPKWQRQAGVRGATQGTAESKIKPLKARTN